MIPNLKVDVLEPVLCKGKPGEPTFEALENRPRLLPRSIRKTDLRLFDIDQGAALEVG